MNRKTARKMSFGVVIAVGLMLVDYSGAEQPPVTAQKDPDPVGTPLREVYFGTMHAHTSFSADAFIWGTRATPDDAYRFAKGEAIKHASGQTLQIHKPLDFMAVTDHPEYMGVLPGLLDPTNPLSKNPIAKELLSSDPDVRSQAAMKIIGSIINRKPIPELVDPAVSHSAWQQTIQTAETHNQPGKFTAFIGFEWTSNGPKGTQNLHRYLVFRGSNVFAEPFSTFKSIKPEDLWTEMEKGRAAGIDSIAVPHNANLSDGMMYATVDSYGKPFDKVYIQRRMLNEPIHEIVQIKGASETHPELSPMDEFANFEINDFLIEGEDTGKTQSKPKGSYIRDAYRKGLLLEEQIGLNPFKFGLVGDSDTHNAAGNYEESHNFGGHAFDDGTPERRLKGTGTAALFKYFSSSGLVGVWAEQNTRDSLFEAFRRRETFATTGPRIPVRFFGGWDYAETDITDSRMAKIGYEKGVPMGNDLRAKPEKAAAPTFIVWARKDPDSANLDRIQIVKGWSKGQQSFEKVYDVVWSGERQPDPKSGKLPPVGNTVDISNATYNNTIGATELSDVWTDPDFDPQNRAFYYVRVLEIPTPRWSTFDAIKLAIAPLTEVSPTIQERAFSSPIWYSPRVQ